MTFGISSFFPHEGGKIKILFQKTEEIVAFRCEEMLSCCENEDNNRLT